MRYPKTRTTKLLETLHSRGWQMPAIASELGYASPDRLYEVRRNGVELPPHRLEDLRELVKSRRRYPAPWEMPPPIDDPRLPRRRRATPEERKKRVRDVLYRFAGTLLRTTSPEEIVTTLATVDAVAEEVIAAVRQTIEVEATEDSATR